MKQPLLLLVLIMLPLVARADAVEIDGIYYNLVTKAKQAEVTSSPNKYSGFLVIPEVVTYQDIVYSVTSIGGTAFMYCSGLTSVTIPNSVMSIGGAAFMNCSGLTSVTIPNSVTSIGNTAFEGCSGLTSINIPISVTSINDFTFRYCSGLTSVTIPKSVTEIGYAAFEGCSSLTSVTIPNSVTSMAMYAFKDCIGLNKVIVSDIAAWCSIKFRDSANPLYYAKHLYSDENKEIKDLIVPNSVTSIGSYAFCGCTGLTSVSIPNSVTGIGGNAFGSCSGLNTITIPNSVTNIGDYAFMGCSGLTSVIIGSGINSIGSLAFGHCIELSEVYCYAEAVPITNSYAFEDSYIDYATLLVPNSSIDLYKNATPWNGFKEIVGIVMPKHKLIYMVDNVVYKEYEIEEGATITPEPAPTKEGYTFFGWSEVPETMPAHDVTVTGSFTINSYKLTYMIDDKVYKETMYEYGAIITPESQPEGDYATFEWKDLPQTMPAHDVVVYASYTLGISEVLMTTQRNIRIYSPNGKKRDKLQKGLNIVVPDDGTVKKVVVK